MRNLALMGKARSGKDTVAARLTVEHGYERVAFADPLKDMALSINPIVASDGIGPFRLKPLVAAYGWERAKDEYTEVRRILQTVGQSIRSYDPDYWVNVAMRTITERTLTKRAPVVVTDVRYPNEAEALRVRGFILVRVVRPGRPDALTPAEQAASAHTSEVALDDWTPDVLIFNGGSLAELDQRVDALMS
jgi:hypothetical protein